MSERLTAVYEGKTICAFDLTDELGQYIEEKRSEIRLASQSGGLKCPECKSRLILCAGAVREPYFRHFSLEECPATVAMKTEAGKRSYYCRRMLFDLAKKSGCIEVTLEERHSDLLKPVLFSVSEKKKGFVYLDGKTRDYKQLRLSARKYREQNCNLTFFLPLKYMTNGMNLTSDEAEIANMNRGIIYYIDKEKELVAIRKHFVDRNRIRQNFTLEYDVRDVKMQEDGEISSDFLEKYHSKVKAEKCGFSKVLRIPVEDGLDEDYFEMDYVCMDTYEEIWVLPAFLHCTEDALPARENRIFYLEKINEEAQTMDVTEREALAYNVCQQIVKNRNSWDWDM